MGCMAYSLSRALGCVAALQEMGQITCCFFGRTYSQLEQTISQTRTASAYESRCCRNNFVISLLPTSGAIVCSDSPTSSALHVNFVILFVYPLAFWGHGDPHRRERWIFSSQPAGMADSASWPRIPWMRLQILRYQRSGHLFVSVSMG